MFDVPAVHDFDSDAFRAATGDAAPDPILRDVLRCMNLAPQRSSAWFKARSNVIITGSKLSGLLFLDTARELLQWREELLGLRPRPPFDALAQARMAFGRENEERATIATLKTMREAGHGITIFEAGFCAHPLQQTGSSPDGIVLWSDTSTLPHACSAVMNFELKCSCKPEAHKSVPYYYIPQLLFEMRHLSAASGHDVRQTIFSSWSIKNHKVWLVHFSDALWDCLWSCVTETILLDTRDAGELNRLLVRLRQLREQCARFSATTSLCVPLHRRGGWPALDVPANVQLPGTAASLVVTQGRVDGLPQA